jgi:hypothetical protein
MIWYVSSNLILNIKIDKICKRDGAHQCSVLWITTNGETFDTAQHKLLLLCLIPDS